MIDTIKAICDDIYFSLSNALGIAIVSAIVILVCVTTPLWIVPYAIVKRRKEKKNETD